MHQRGIGWVGAIAAMVVAGLIVYGVIYYGPEVWRGIEGIGGSDILSPIEVREHPNNYLNKEITIEGYYGGPGPFEMFVGKYVAVIAEKYPSEDTSSIVGVVTGGVSIELIEGGRYRFRGRLVQTELDILRQLTPVTLIAFEAEPA